MTEMTYKNVRPSREHFGETNDCSVIAVSIVTNESYEKALHVLDHNGREFRKGSYPDQQQAALRDLGYEKATISGYTLLKYWNLFTGGRPNRKPDAHDKLYRTFTIKNLVENPELLDGATALVRVKGHVAAWKNDQLEDWSKTTKMRIREIDIVWKRGEPRPKIIDEIRNVKNAAIFHAISIS